MYYQHLPSFFYPIYVHTSLNQQQVGNCIMHKKRWNEKVEFIFTCAIIEARTLNNTEIDLMITTWRVLARVTENIQILEPESRLYNKQNLGNSGVARKPAELSATNFTLGYKPIIMLAAISLTWSKIFYIRLYFISFFPINLDLNSFWFELIKLCHKF